MSKTTERREKMRVRTIREIDAIEAALKEYRKAIEFDALLWDEWSEYINVLDAIYSLTQIDAVHDKAREIEFEAASCGK